MLQIAQWIAGIATGLAIVLAAGLAIYLLRMLIRDEWAERRSKRREQPPPYQPNPYTPFKLRLREYEAFAQAYEKANSLRSSAPPDGPNPSSPQPSPSSSANPAETPTPSATAAIPSAFSSSGTGGFDTRGRVLTIGLTKPQTQESHGPSTAMTSSVGSEPGSSGVASRE